MPLRSRTIRVSDRTWEYVKREADHQGITANAWVAEAIIGRLTYSLIQRNDQMAQDFITIFDLIVQLRDDP